MILLIILAVTLAAMAIFTFGWCLGATFATKAHSDAIARKFEGEE